jgi:hypothetical protein
VKVYTILTQVGGDVLVHGKAYHDWNLAVRYLVETCGIDREDILAVTDPDGHKLWRVTTHESATFLIHQLDLI